MRYVIEVREQGSVIVTDHEGRALWSQEARTPSSDPETLCDALLAALSWTVQRYSGALTVSVPERSIATGLASENMPRSSSRIAMLLEEARTLLTWFETTDVACCGNAVSC